MKHEFWTIAYRRRSGRKTLLDNRESPFQVIPNNWRYWYADPHLIRVGQDTWIFAEAYDRILRRGVISCCMLTETGATPWKVVLKQPCHLSYPHLLEKDGQVWMIPESYVANEIAVFRAKRFPDCWEKAAVLKTGGEPVDSTVFSQHGKHWLLTMQLENGKDRLMLYALADSGLSGGWCAAESDGNTRPAGNLFRCGDALIRPAQDCSDSYGCALNFYEVTRVDECDYQEALLCKLHPGDIHSNLPKEASGIHTYNMTEDYEVIDLKTYETDLWAFPMRIVWGVWRRIKKLIMIGR